MDTECIRILGTYWYANVQLLPELTSFEGILQKSVDIMACLQCLSTIVKCGSTQLGMSEEEFVSGWMNLRLELTSGEKKADDLTVCFQTLSTIVEFGSTRLGMSEEELIRCWMDYRAVVSGKRA